MLALLQRCAPVPTSLFFCVLNRRSRGPPSNAYKLTSLLLSSNRPCSSWSLHRRKCGRMDLETSRGRRKERGRFSVGDLRRAVHAPHITTAADVRCAGVSFKVPASLNPHAQLPLSSFSSPSLLHSTTTQTHNKVVATGATHCVGAWEPRGTRERDPRWSGDAVVSVAAAPT